MQKRIFINGKIKTRILDYSSYINPVSKNKKFLQGKTLVECQQKNFQNLKKEL